MFISRGAHVALFPTWFIQCGKKTSFWIRNLSEIIQISSKVWLKIMKRQCTKKIKVTDLRSQFRRKRGTFIFRKTKLYVDSNYRLELHLTQVHIQSWNYVTDELFYKISLKEIQWNTWELESLFACLNVCKLELKIKIPMKVMKVLKVVSRKSALRDLDFVSRSYVSELVSNVVQLCNENLRLASSFGK